MIETIDTSLIDWSRAQFALTAMYHWLFVPLTLGLTMIIGIMESIYVYTKNEFWKTTVKFWMKLFGINFAIGIATGLILEFEFGTNWSNYSWFVGDIFGAPLAIEGIFAFFMEATFIAIMFFGWNKVSQGWHLAATWLTGFGATLSAWWILVANAWMQYPVGMKFNPETVRNEMDSFAAVALSPAAVAKFMHTVLSSWILGALFVAGISCWYLIKKRNIKFAKASLLVAAVWGLTATITTAFSGDISGVQMAKHQPMKLAVAEGLYDGGTGMPFTIIGEIKVPKMLSFLSTHNFNGYVPGINNILDGGYVTPNGETALSAKEKMHRGNIAITALDSFRMAKKANNIIKASKYERTLHANIKYFGYGFIKDKASLVPPVNMVFWSFRIMVFLGMFFILLFAGILWFHYKGSIQNTTWLQFITICSIPLGYIASQAGWIVAEVGRQPWAIQDLLPVGASVSNLHTDTVQTTFYIFLIIFTTLLIAEIGIMIKAIAKGPEK